MTIQYNQLPLYSDAHYSYSVGLEGQTFNLEFIYIDRMNHWIFNLRDGDGVGLVLGEILSRDHTVFANYALESLSGFFWLTPKANLTTNDLVSVRRSLPDYFDFYYIYDDGN